MLAFSFFGHAKCMRNTNFYGRRGKKQEIEEKTLYRKCKKIEGLEMEHFCLGIITIQKFTKNENSQKMRDKKIKKAYKLIR